MLRLAVLALVSLFLVSCGQQMATVDCRNIGMGYNCSVSHTAGNKPLSVCWELAVKCKNGLVANSTGCQLVNPGSTAIYFMPLTDIAHVEKCDEVSSFQVVNKTIVVQ